MYTLGQEKFLLGAKDFIEKQIPRREYLSLQGYPGTGKTYIIALLSEYLGLGPDEIVYAVFTGKATSVLAFKVSREISVVTIHKLIYDVDTGSAALKFIKKDRLDKDYKLIIIDEQSTVNKSMMNDLFSFGIPIIIAGDYGQLPPIGEETTYLREPDYVLDQILRQHENSYIHKVCRKIMQGWQLKPIKFHDIEIIDMDHFKEEYYFECDQIISGTNETKDMINKKVRQLKKKYDNLPEPGERLICTKNNWNILIDGRPLVNGMTGKVLKVRNTADSDYFIIQFQPDYSECNAAIKVSREYFNGINNKNNYEWFEWGYCINAYKSQGSEYDTVLLFADNMPKHIMNRFLNTGISRAKKFVRVVVDKFRVSY